MNMASIAIVIIAIATAFVMFYGLEKLSEA